MSNAQKGRIMSRLHHAGHPKASPEQSWGPRNPEAPAPPSQSWPGQPQGVPPGQPPYQRQAAPLPRKRHRVFFWVFLSVQILFLIWVITGAASGSGTPDSCQGMTGDALKTCNDAGNVGTAIGVGLIIGLWAAADVILGITYMVYRLASRQPRT
ncbi:hypothetical protein OG194_21250 [Streptomyces sp. NBC_01288]|uniref:hypothetical protein n=2 Tax=Streptomyces TaxID=1883 RepID=UPI002E0E4CC5|nr:hypothetical protein OG194_21250 [Streptomyces sp. NBC_01288]